MTAFEGLHFDGTRAVGVPVHVEGQGDEIVIADAVSAPRRLRREQINVDAPIPGVHRILRLPDGELIETSDQAAVTTLWPSHGGIERVAFALESRWWAALAGLGLTAASVWLIVAFALPLAADSAARLISAKVEHFIGEHSLATLDRIALKPSTLTANQQAELTAKFDRFVSGEPDAKGYKLAFRKVGTANAFALPGGIIVISDEMVRLTESDDEFLAVIAHEAGHVRGRHALRMVLQDSGLAVLMTVLAGDAVGTTILAAAVPSVLLRSRYSRQFETEADDYAFAMLKRHNQPPKAFADMLRRLQKEKPGAQDGSPIVQYLSTHPATEERIRRAEEQR